jgi:hypothetical protein
MQRVQAQ